MADEDLSIPDFKMRNERAFLPAFTHAQPKGQHIAVRPIVEPLSTVLEVKSGARDRIVKGEVLAVGPRVKSDIRVGEIIFFSQIQRYEIHSGLWIIRDLNLAFVQEDA